MILKNKFLSTFLTAVMLIFLFACGQDSSNKSVMQTENIKPEEVVLTIDTFSTFPPEIEGPTCYCSNDSLEFEKGEYIYVSDFDSVSFLKINGLLTRFKENNYKEIDSTRFIQDFISKNYKMTIESNYSDDTGYETWRTNGKIKLLDIKSGKTIIKTYFGECGQ